MSDTFNYILNLQAKDNNVFASFNKVNQGIVNVENSINKVNKSFSSSITKIQTSLQRLDFVGLVQKVNSAADGLNSMADPGMRLSSNMADLSAITGVTGSKLKEIEGYARASAKTFGTDASDGVEAYKLILSQLNPEIANVPPALKEMGNVVGTLSKTMGGDTVAATEVLTTAMNQYQVSTEDPMAASKEMADMMNIMAAAAKEGSAELPQIQQALSQSGMAAKMAGVTFSETNAAIQVLDKAGKKGAEGGVALRNVMATLAQGRFLPKDVQDELKAAGVNVNTLVDQSLSLTDRMAPLKKIMGDSALVTKLFGKENNNAALALISGLPEIDRLNGAIQGTNTAYEQAAVIMDSPAEKAKRLQAKVDDLKISIFNGTNGWLGYVGVLGDVARDITNLSPILTGFGKVIMFVTNAEKMKALWTGAVGVATNAWTAAQWLLNGALWANPITWLVLGVIALIGVILYLINTYSGWGEAWGNLMDYLGYTWKGFMATFNYLWLNVVDGFMSGVNLIQKAWYKVKGLWDEDGAEAGLKKLDSEAAQRAKEMAEAKGKMEEFKQLADLSASKVGLTKKEGSVADTVTGLKDSILPPAPGANNKGGAGGGSGSGPGKKTNEAIATGGTKNTTINISIGKQIETLQVVTNNLKEGAGRIRDIVLDEMTRVVAASGAIAND